MNPRRLIFLATRNPGKIREIKSALAGMDVEFKDLSDFPGIREPEETGDTFAENARQKAVYYSKATGQWCLADDSGLEVDALGGEPGVQSARYAADRIPAGSPRAAVDAANNAKLLEKLQGVPDEKRTARFICHLALADGERILIETFDTVEGRISRQPRGDNGFGYDPLFEVVEAGCSMAELSQEQKNRISHRGKAVRHFAGLLQSVLKSMERAVGGA
jgi:XTP/dITP diphosphohydrolase